MFTLRHTGISGKCLKSVLCLVFTLSPLALTAQSCVLNPSQFAYVANGEGTISGYRLNATNGQLSPIAGSPFVTGFPTLNSVAVDPTNRFLYADYGVINKNVEAYTINCVTGELTPIPGSPFSTGGSPFGIAFHPSGRFAYFADFGGSTVSAFKIDPTNGQLQLIATYPTGTFPVAIAVDPLGKFVYVVNQVSDNISGYTINPLTGALTPMTGSPFPTETYPASVAIDPNDRFVYVANQGAANVSGYTINATTGALSTLDTSPFAAGQDGEIFSVTVDPTGAYVYVGGYGGVFSYSINQSITAFNSRSYPPKQLFGQLTPIQGSPFGGGAPNSVVVDYTGTFLYSGDSSSRQISVYTLSGGVLTPATNPTTPEIFELLNIALVRPQTLPSFTATQVAQPNGFGSPQTLTASGINDNGAVVGTVVYYPEAGEYFAQGFLSTATTSKDIALGDVGAACGVNDNGQVVGQSYTTPASPFQTPPQAFLYRSSNNSIIDLDTVKGRHSAALAINNAGQITGSLSTGTCVPPFNAPTGCQGNTHAFFYNGSGLVDIGTLGGLNSTGTSIDNLGIVVGISATASGANHLFSYLHGHMYDLGTAAGQSFGNAIVNDLGEILAISGGSNGAGVSYLWRNNVFTKLPFVGASLNNRTEIVGAKAATTAGSRAYLYYNGASIDLNELVDPSLPLFTSANGINNNGTIVATGLNGQIYVLTPK
jgi:probable HAF family extracellular repeat protein